MNNIEKRKEEIQERMRSLSNEIVTLENQQMSIKILMNSLYGALG